MSYASDAKLKELDERVIQLEALVAALNGSVAALKVKLEAVEALTIPRPKRTPRDIVNSNTGERSWVPPTIP